MNFGKSLFKSNEEKFSLRRVEDQEKYYNTIFKATFARSSAVAVIADRTAYDVRYNWNKPLSRIAVVIVSINLFTVSN